MANTPVPRLPESAFCTLPVERMQYLVELYRRAVATGDERIVDTASEALKHFRDAEAALTRTFATEAALLRLIDPSPPSK